MKNGREIFDKDADSAKVLYPLAKIRFFRSAFSGLANADIIQSILLALATFVFSSCCLTISVIR